MNALSPVARTVSSTASVPKVRNRAAAIPADIPNILTLGVYRRSASRSRNSAASRLWRVRAICTRSRCSWSATIVAVNGTGESTTARRTSSARTRLLTSTTRVHGTGSIARSARPCNTGDSARRHVFLMNPLPSSPPVWRSQRRPSRGRGFRMAVQAATQKGHVVDELLRLVSGNVARGVNCRAFVPVGAICLEPSLRQLIWCHSASFPCGQDAAGKLPNCDSTPSPRRSSHREA